MTLTRYTNRLDVESCFVYLYHATNFRCCFYTESHSLLVDLLFCSIHFSRLPIPITYVDFSVDVKLSRKNVISKVCRCVSVWHKCGRFER